MEFLRKRVKFSIVIALVFVAGAVAYSWGYSTAIRKFNEIVSYNQEKEKMYSRLSEIDKIIRQEYINDIDEDTMTYGMCNGYIEGLEDSLCRYLTPDEYKKYSSKKSFDEDSIFYENIDSQLGYIRIKQVNSETGNLFSNAIRTLFNENIKNIIIDIRGVNTGNLSSIEKCLDAVSKQGEIISTIDKRGNKEEVYKTNSDRMDINFCLLVNNKTKGVCELIAMALKDANTGKIIGQNTAGEVFLEKATALSDGYGLLYPCAHYVTSKGEIINKKGVTPDIVEEISEEDEKLLEEGKLERENDKQFISAKEYLMELSKTSNE